MKGLRFITVAVSIIFGQVVIINNATRAEGLGNVGYCFDAAFHEKTNRLYVTAGAAGTHVLDVNEGKFQFITTIQDGGYHRNLKISGDRAFVADAKRGLVVYDITEKIPIRTWQQQEQNMSGMGIYIHDNHAYLAGGNEGLYIFDVSNPDTPRRVSTCKTNADAWDVWISDKYAYVADLQKGVTVLDVSQPSRPQKVALVTWNEIEPMAEIIRGEGETVYVAAGKHGLVILDISNPLEPKVISKYKSGPGGFGEGLCVKNSLVYLSNGNEESKDENGLIIIDAKNPHSLEVKGRCTFGGWVEGVCLAGNHAFVTNTYSGVRSIDISDPNNPKLVDSIGPVKKNDPLLESEMSDEEARAIEEYRRIKSQILTGGSYNDSSTPLRAVLTRFASWEPDERDYFIGLDIFRAPLPPAKPEEGSLWPVFAGDTELADTFVLVYIKGQWIWIGNVGSSYDWRLGKSTFEKWAREKIGQSVPSGDSGNAPSADARAPEESAGNRVLSLDGEGDYVLVADSESLRSFSNAITIEVWFKASSFYPENGMVNSIIRKNITAQAENFFLRFRNVAGVPNMEMSVGYDIPGLRAPYNFAVDTWYHLAGTYNGSTITVFVNGLSIKSEIASGSLYIDNSDLFIGKGDPEFSFGEFFHGALDELRIWNIARSPEEIQAAMNSPLTGKEDGLVVYLNFDDGTAKDLSGHGNDGVLSENARIVESPYPASVRKEQQNRLLAWWRLDEADGNDVADSSGNACGGKLIGNPQWWPAGGKVGGALEFDGDGDCVRIDDESAFDIEGPITIAAWFKVNTFDKRWQALITKGDTSWRLQRYAEDNTLAFHCTGIASVTSERPEGIEGKKNVNDGQWHHVVGVYDGSEILLYIDGVLDNSSKASGEIRMNDSAVIIGGNSEQSGREWNGLIDEVDIIGGAIDANAVHALYTGADPIIIAQKANPLLQSSDKLVAWWKFEDDVNDSAGANHGTIHGNPTYVDGRIGRAISLDGDDYVDCGNPDLLNFGTGDWAISAWIKTTQTGTNQDDASMNRGTVFAKGGDEAGGIRYALAVNEGQLGSITLTTDDDEYKIQAVGKTAINDGVWHHIVGMRNGGQLRIYIDGVLDGGGYLSSEYDLSDTSQHNAYIGVITDNRDSSLYKYFVGLIDEVCIFAGAIDATGIRALYSGEDPVTVAKTALIRSKVQPRPTSSGGAAGNIEGDWRIVSDQVSQQVIIEIREKADGTFAAAIVAEDPDETSQAILLDEITFINGRLHFEAPTKQTVFDGTMKEDGSTIEGSFQQQGQIIEVELKRVATQRGLATITQEQLRGRTGGTSNIAVALVLVLVLAAVVGGIVYFLVKSSVR